MPSRPVPTLATLALMAVAAALAAPARAEVTAAGPQGFTSSFRQEVKATPAEAVEAVGRLPQWWNPAHSYSGQSANLRMGLKAGDCFCEQWEGNSIEHARVLQVQRERLVRLAGALGPLQELPVRGVLSFSAQVVDGKTVLGLVYRVAGAPEAGLERLAPIVDRVIGEQFNRWVAHVNGGGS
jgi:hypothetical protein